MPLNGIDDRARVTACAGIGGGAARTVRTRQPAPAPMLRRWLLHVGHGPPGRIGAAAAGLVAGLAAAAPVVLAAGLTAAAAMIAAGAAAAAEPLPRASLAGGVTVSGLSSGGFFAHQFHVAFSGVVEGAAILAGGPYACAEDIPAGLWANPAPEVATAIAVCTHIGRDMFGGFSFILPSGPDADASLEAIEAAFRDGAIDDPANLADDRVWLFAGGRDEVVPERTMAAVAEVYRALGVAGDALASEAIGGAGHGFPVAAVGDSDFGSPGCDAHGPPYLIDCDFDAAGALLRHLYGNLDDPVPPVRAHLLDFDQTPFFDAADASVSLAEAGFVYVPAACAAADDGGGAGGAGNGCRLHVALHGCRQNADAVGDDFVWDAGYNGWAEANAIVVLYPQTAAWTRASDPSGLLGNPRGCWDWWGYSGDAYATRDGVQMRAVRAMIDALRGP